MLTLRVCEMLSENITLTVFDHEDNSKDRFIGEAELKLSDLMKGGDRTVGLLYQDRKSAGKIMINTTFYKDIVVV